MDDEERFIRWFDGREARSIGTVRELAWRAWMAGKRAAEEDARTSPQDREQIFKMQSEGDVH